MLKPDPNLETGCVPSGLPTSSTRLPAVTFVVPFGVDLEYLGHSRRVLSSWPQRRRLIRVQPEEYAAHLDPRFPNFRS